MEDFYKFEKDCCKVSELDIQAPAAMKRSQIKKGIMQGEKFDSSWEAAFYIWAREVRGFAVERNHTQWIAYIAADGKQHRFYPDFVCNGQYYEIKGRWGPNDLAKKDQCPSVIFLDGTEMKDIIKEVNMYRPGWRNEYLVTS